MICNRGLHYKTLRICILQKTDRCHSKLLSSALSVTAGILAWTNTTAYYRISTLRARNVFIMHAPGSCIITPITAVINSITYKASAFVRACTTELITAVKSFMRLAPGHLNLFLSLKTKTGEFFK